MSSRLAKKYATNKAAETEGIYYEEVDDEGPLFKVRLARIGGDNNKYKEKLNKLMKPYRSVDISFKIRERIILDAFTATCIIPHSWQTFVTSEEVPAGEWKPGIEDPASGQLLPATVENYHKVLGQLPELFDRLVNEASTVDNYKFAALEAESKN